LISSISIAASSRVGRALTLSEERVPGRQADNAGDGCWIGAVVIFGTISLSVDCATGTRDIPGLLWPGTFAAEQIAEDATLFGTGCDLANCEAAEGIDFFGAVTEAGCRAICDEFVGAIAAICCLFAAATAAKAFVLSRNFSLRC